MAAPARLSSVCAAVCGGQGGRQGVQGEYQGGQGGRQRETAGGGDWASVTSSSIASQLHLGELDHRTLPSSFVRTFMQPEPDGPTETERIIAGLPSDIGLGASPRPLLGADGSLQNLAWLTRLRAEAAETHDYRRAAYLHQLLHAIDPAKPSLTLRDTAPEGVEAKVQFFLENGFVCVENALSGAALADVQAAFAHFEAPSKQQWTEARHHNSGMARHSFKESDDGYPIVARKWFGITGLTYNTAAVNPAQKPFLELDPSFVNLIDSAGQTDEVWKVVERVLVGPGPAELDLEPDRASQRGDIRCTGCSPRTYPADADAEGYVRAMQSPNQSLVLSCCSVPHFGP